MQYNQKEILNVWYVDQSHSRPNHQWDGYKAMFNF